MSSLVGKYVGVTFSSRKNRWIVRYSHQGVRKYVGSFIFEEDANKAYEEFLESLNITIKDSASVGVLPSEEFRPVIGYEEDYTVSNLGRVCSIKYGKYRLLKPYKTGTGYKLVKLNGRSRAIHLLVAAAFLGHNSNGTHELVVDHIDRDKENNCVENLQVVTQRENIVKDLTNKYVGATLHKKSGRYFSRVYFNKTHYYLGYFKTAEEAHQAYLNKLNFLNNNI